MTSSVACLRRWCVAMMPERNTKLSPIAPESSQRHGLLWLMKQATGDRQQRCGSATSVDGPSVGSVPESLFCNSRQTAKNPRESSAVRQAGQVLPCEMCPGTNAHAGQSANPVAGSGSIDGVCCRLPDVQSRRCDVRRAVPVIRSRLRAPPVGAASGRHRREGSIRFRTRHGENRQPSRACR